MNWLCPSCSEEFLYDTSLCINIVWRHALLTFKTFFFLSPDLVFTCAKLPSPDILKVSGKLVYLCLPLSVCDPLISSQPHQTMRIDWHKLCYYPITYCVGKHDYFLVGKRLAKIFFYFSVFDLFIFFCFFITGIEYIIFYFDSYFFLFKEVPSNPYSTW